MDGVKTSSGKNRLLADGHYQRAHAAWLLAPLRGQAEESERESLHGFGEQRAVAQRSKHPAVEVDGKLPLVGAHHDVGGDVC